MKKRISPDFINKLEDNEIFVFGSNLRGMHGGGAARVAMEKFGAEWGVGVGRTGQTYAIPTMHGGVDAIKPYVDEFVEYAKAHPELKFLVTRIGCGIAGFRDKDIAPLFAECVALENVFLPKKFVDIVYNEISKKNISRVSWSVKNDFLDEYTPLMEKVGKGDLGSYSKVKTLRVKEFQNTIKLVNDGFYYTEGGCKVVINKTEQMIADSRFYSSEFSVQDVEPQAEQTIVEVVNADCLDEGLRLLNMGYNPAILNMASRQNPGGGVISGAGAQEETIFRRSNIFRSLYQFASYAEQYGLPKSDSQYPLDRNFGGVYSPCVTVFRDNEKSGYKLLSDPYEIAFISVAGMNRPELNRNGMIVDSLVEPIKHKIRTIFRIGLKHGHDALVLGALGCGAFRNPPRHIARLFHEVMDEVEFKNKFKHIVFAILEDHNSHKAHNTEGNFLPFKEEFL